MRKTEKIGASVLSAVLLAAVFVAMVLAASSPRGQGQRGPGGDGAVGQKELRHRSDFDVITTPEEKQVRDVYARLMRYHTAAKDALAAAGGIPPKPEDYVVFESRDIHSGSIEEISGTVVGELVTSPGGDALKVTPHHLAYGSGPRHAYYDVEWDAAAAQAGIDEQGTLGEMLSRVAGKYRDVTSYTSYEVTVKLAGKQRTYRALALHRSRIGPSGKPDTEILDNLTPEMNAVLADESPRVIAPWETYIKSSLYLAVARSIAKAENAGRPLIPADAPIGYLPGDDVSVSEASTAARKGRASSGISPQAEVSTVNFIEQVVQPWNNSWGAMTATQWTVDIEVYNTCTPAGGVWNCYVSQADSTYQIFYRLLPGVSEATTAAATAENYCIMIQDLSSLGGLHWYMVSAVEAHERVHVSEWKASLLPRFYLMKQTIGGLSVPGQPGMTADQAKVAIKALPAYSAAVADAYANARNDFANIADPNSETDAAEHSVVDPMVAAIRQKASANGWAPCQ
jgi:hypothetical protein